MILRIISSARSGVELAALDVARKLGLDHGGWVAKGKPRHNAALISTYKIRETDSFGDPGALERNVKDADGVLLISRGERIDRLQHTVKTALKHQRQFLGIDLKQYPLFEAASLIHSWTDIQNVRNVFITGAFESEVPGIYQDTHKILETVLYLSSIKSYPNILSKNKQATMAQSGAGRQFPGTVDECVDQLKDALSLKERTMIANMQADELGRLRSGMGEFVKNKFGLYYGNDRLMQSCAKAGKLANPLVEEACAVILRALWQNLRRTHKLRVIR